MTRIEFETKLNEVYGGTVTPLTTYVNERAVMVFCCSQCHYTFFGKPSHIVGKEHQRHECFKPYGDKNGERLEKVSFVHGRKAKKKDQQAILDKINAMIWNDYTYQQIAQELKVNPNIIKDYFKSEGLIE